MNTLRPSSAGTWIVCHGYPKMRAAFPEIPEEADNDVREDGTACHWLAERIWHKEYPALNSLSPNGRVLDEDMFDAVDLYHDVLRSWDAGELHIEQIVPCDVIYPRMTGTPDAWGYNPMTRTLHIADLKYGFRFVEVWENWQLVVYLASLINMLDLNDQTLTIKAYIVQPRSNHRDGPVRQWTCKGTDLRAQANMLRQAAAEAMKPNPLCTPNPGCTDCPGRHACVALQNAALRAVEQSYSSVPLELTPAAIGTELSLLQDAEKRLSARITGLTMQAETLLRSGQVIPRFTLATTYARERWMDGAESQVLTLGPFYNVDVAKPRQAITPTQARKLLPLAVVAAFAHKPSTGVKLTRQDPFEARKKFQQPTE